MQATTMLEPVLFSISLTGHDDIVESNYLDSHEDTGMILLNFISWLTSSVYNSS